MSHSFVSSIFNYRHRSRQDQWKAQKEQLENEIKNKLMQLVAYEERLEAQKRMAAKRQEEEADEACDMCTNYE